VPRAELPSTPVGWAVALAASLAGLLAGFLVMAAAGKIL
jgi:hypothetical protein